MALSDLISGALRKSGKFFVKKLRLFERSEFLPLSKKVQNLALEVQSALFLFGSFSFWCQKEKEH